MADDLRAAIDLRIDELVDSGRRAWPEVTVTRERLAGWLVDRVGAAEAGVEPGAGKGALDRLALDDLYLACACVDGDGAAIAAFTRSFLPHVEAAVLGLGAAPSDVEEVRDSLLHALFVAAPGRSPGIAGYAGRGRLRSWVRSIAVRIAMRHLGQAHRGRLPGDGDEAMLDALPADRSDPELEHLRERYGEPFREAFRQALGALSPRERNVLRQHYIDELTVDQLGALYRVHRATAARWVAAARQVVFDDTRQRLVESLGVRAGELDSLLRVLRSQLDVSIQRYLTADSDQK